MDVKHHVYLHKVKRVCFPVSGHARHVSVRSWKIYKDRVSAFLRLIEFTLRGNESLSSLCCGSWRRRGYYCIAFCALILYQMLRYVGSNDCFTLLFDLVRYNCLTSIFLQIRHWRGEGWIWLNVTLHGEIINCAVLIKWPPCEVFASYLQTFSAGLFLFGESGSHCCMKCFLPLSWVCVFIAL